MAAVIFVFPPQKKGHLCADSAISYFMSLNSVETERRIE